MTTTISPTATLKSDVIMLLGDILSSNPGRSTVLAQSSTSSSLTSTEDHFPAIDPKCGASHSELSGVRCLESSLVIT